MPRHSGTNGWRLQQVLLRGNGGTACLRPADSACP